jgi:F0F1-type ATP synthase assembly protein I
MIDKAKGTPKYDSWSQQYALIKAIGFTYADLDANRGGYMTKKQRAALSQERRILFSTVAIIIAGAVILHLIVLSINSMKSDAILYGILGFLILFLPPVSLALFAWFQRRRLNADLYKGTVYVVEGVISLHVRRHGDYGYFINRNNRNTVIYYYMSIQDEKFRLEKSVFDAFVDGEPYAIYYAPHSKTILSAEWLRETEVNDFAGGIGGEVQA